MSNPYAQIMTVADKVTMSRIILAPFFFIIYMYKIFSPSLSVILLWILFIIIELSDFLDGQVARSSDQVSSFGKLFDPFADVLARVTYFVCFAFSGLMPLWVLLIILYREFSILFLRMMLSFRQIAMGARPGGKLKAGVYMLAGLLSLLQMTFAVYFPASTLMSVLKLAAQIAYYGAALLSVLSFADYLSQYQKLIREKK